MRFSVVVLVAFTYFKCISAQLSLLQYASQAITMFKDYNNNDSNAGNTILTQILRKMTVSQVSEISDFIQNMFSSHMGSFAKDFGKFVSLGHELQSEETNHPNNNLNQDIPMSLIQNMMTNANQIEFYTQYLCNKTLAAISYFGSAVKTMTFAYSQGQQIDIQTKYMSGIRQVMAEITNVLPPFRNALNNLDNCLVQLQHGANNLGQPNSAFGNIEKIFSKYNADLITIQTGTTNIVNNFAKYQLITSNPSAQTTLPAIITGFRKDLGSVVVATLNMGNIGPSLRTNIQTIMTMMSNVQ